MRGPFRLFLQGHREQLSGGIRLELACHRIQGIA